jgi:hypothetical protein
MAGPPQAVRGSGLAALNTAIIQPATDTTHEDQPHTSILTSIAHGRRCLSTTPWKWRVAELGGCALDLVEQLIEMLGDVVVHVSARLLEEATP